MKSILMLLSLAALSSPAMANPDTNTSECLQMYRTYINDYGASKFIPPKKMLSFIYRCMPADYSNTSIQKGVQKNQGVIHIHDDSRKTFTTKT